MLRPPGRAPRRRARRAEMTRPDATAELFESLARRGHEPMLEQAEGTLCFVIGDGRPDRWFVTVDRGDVAVSRRSRKADCTVRASKPLFDGIASGEVNALTAFLRGAVSVEGDPELLMLFQRLFPAPPARR